MKKSRFTETQVISILKEYDGGMKAEDVCRRHGISTATLFNWRKKYADEAQQLKQLRELQEENSRLKRMYADLSLDHELLKEILEKKAPEAL